MNIQSKIDQNLFLPELRFQTSRSSGPGGQNVNKTETRVSLIFSVFESAVLSEAEKGIILKKLSNRIDSAGQLNIHVQEKRSQLQNKEIAIKKFHELLRSAFKKKKLRIATKPHPKAIEKRLKDKKVRSLRKKERRGE